ncbi:hypothetical protein F183_A42430 [Bryobacterales bacterium F-183]|nr:hypothetical protein F183_A42430 [Bryobacterales bacterium F-183]
MFSSAYLWYVRCITTHTMLFELRLALRRLLARPGFTLTAISSLALGIGAVTIFFSLLHSTLLKPLPARNPEQLVSLVDTRFGAPVIANPNIRDMRPMVAPFMPDLMSYRIAPINFGMEGRASSRAWGYVVSGNYFTGLGVSAARGRLIGPEDDVTRGAHPVAVLSDLAWKRRLGADPNIVGRTVRLNGFPFTIIGVAPEGFYGTERFYAPELFVPVSMAKEIETENSGYIDDRDSQNTFVVGRLAPGVTVERAQQQMDAVTSQLARQFPKENEGWKLRLTEPGWAGDFLRGSVIGFNAILMAVAGALLLVVCVNLASLLLAQAAERRKETAVRLAIGANRGQLIRQLLLESVALGAIGGAFGLLIAWWGTTLITSYRPPVDFAIQTTVELDWTVALFAAAITLVTSVAFGLVPAIQSTNADLAAAIKQDTSDPRHRRWPLRDILTGAQIAISVVLLICSGLMIKSLSHAMTVNVGFDPYGAAALGFDLAAARYDEPRGTAFERDLLRKVRELPGIQSAAIASSIPLDLNNSNNGVWETGQPEPPASQLKTAQSFWITPGYFETMRTPVLAGRLNNDRDMGKDVPPRLIVNRQFTREILRLKDPATAVGKRVQTSSKTHEIIAVVDDGKYFGLSEAPRSAMFYVNAPYITYARLIWRTNSSSLAPRDSIAQVRATVLAADPSLTIFDAETLEQHMNLPTLPARFAAGAMTIFGLITMLLAAIGIYGVTAFAVSQRTREIGIRMAIGAAPGHIARLFLSRAFLLVGLSAAVGAVLAAFATGLLTPILIGVNPSDWTAHAAGIALMATIALLACLIPTRRAANLDPARSLRRD